MGMGTKVKKWAGCKVLKAGKGWSGGKQGIVDATFLAGQIYPSANYATAFAYLFRRFGETGPFDWHKQLCEYDLTTPDKEVGFYLSCSPCMGPEPGYWLSPDIAAAIGREYRQSRDWPPVDPANPIYGGRMPPEGTASRRAIDAIAAGMRDLLRPVYVRDVPISIVGRLTDKEAAKFAYAEHAWKE